MKSKLKEKLRQFGLTSLAVDNRTSVLLLTFMIILFGVQSYDGMPKESFPEIAWPEIYVNTVYFGNSAEDIENLVTKPIEKEIATISELKKVTSQSLQDYSLIIAEFNTDIDSKDAARKLKDAVDRAKADLPTDLTSEPEVLEINLSEIPIVTINIAGSYSNDELKSYAEYLQDEIEELKEVSKVDLKGALDREVKISADLDKMKAMEVSFTDIENAIRSENLTMSAGEYTSNDFKRSIRIVGEFDTVDELKRLIVKSEFQRSIFLEDIADVSFAFAEKTSISRTNQLPVISLGVIKEKGENQLNASDKITEIIERAKENVLPADLDVTTFNDQSVQTRMMVSNLENSIISGVILVVLVLLFFLGIRNSMFVGVAIPLSMLMGISILQLLGYTLNTVVLFSLILALGMLVDNAIVVVENIYRYMQEGYKPKEAAKYGTGEVALPIIASTATTLAAFLPLAFWPGLMGSFMKYLPITLIIVLASSLFIALVINPVLTSKYMKIDQKADTKEARVRKRKNILIFSGVLFVIALVGHFAGVVWMRNLLAVTIFVSLLNTFFLRNASFKFQANILPRLERGYNKFISFALSGKKPEIIFVGTFGLLFISIILLTIKNPKKEFFPSADPQYVNAFIELPVGTDIEATNKFMEEIERKVEGIIEKNDEIVDAVLAQIGENTSDPNAGPTFGASPNRARLSVSFVPSEERNGVSTFEIMEEIRAGLKGYPGVQIIVDKNQDGPPTGKPINIEITGEEIDVLSEVSAKLIKFINEQNIAGIEELKKDVQFSKPELIVNVDREAARRFGLSTYSISDAIRTSVFGKEVSKFKTNDEDYPIQLRAKDVSRNNISEILNQAITFRNPANGRISQVPIASVAEVEYSTSYTSINRKDQERVITVNSNVLDGYNANEIVAELKEVTKKFELPKGYSLTFTGEQEDQAEAIEFLGTALLIAVFSIFLIIVAQFNSISSPFIIILSVLFSTVGVFFGYVLTDMNIVVIMTGVGIISLAGIVVNNAIVLIDYTNLLVNKKRAELELDDHEKLPKEAVIQAIIKGGETRLRPVLLTAITTVLGLIPLAVGFNFDFFGLIANTDPNISWGGDNAKFWGTMAWTVIYGLVFATFLTLVVVPAMYWIAYRIKSISFNRHK